MNLTSIDLNLLVAFNAIAKERNVTLAANRVGISQPAMSSALARLRKTFNDPLFVRTARGMQPTPYAERLVEPISRACELISGALRLDARFDPTSTSRKTFTFYMTEIGEIVCLPKILRHLQAVAPQISIKVSRIPEKGAQDAMAAGDVDIAVGIFPSLKSGFFQQRLYTDRFVCLVRKDHPTIRGTISTEQFMQSPHAIVSSTGTGHDSSIEQILWAQHLHRKIALAVPHFLVLPTIVAQSDVIATVPCRMADSLGGFANVAILDAPVKFPKIEIRQHWHERYHHDSANQWIRQLIFQLFGE